MDLVAALLLRRLAQALIDLGDVHALWVGGSLATGDYVPGVSDLDLVAVTTRPLVGDRLERAVRMHRELDAGPALGMNLGCQYANLDNLLDVTVEHPTWTHGDLVQRTISLVTRAELAQYGYAVLGPTPHSILPPVTRDEVRRAARAELTGYWAHAARHPGMFARLPVMVDLGLTSMARARHAIATGELLTKSAAIEHVRAPLWLREDLRARRRGEKQASPRWRAALIAWRDVQRTTSTLEKAPSVGRDPRPDA